MQALHKKNSLKKIHAIPPQKKSCNLQKNKSCNLSDSVRKITQPLHKQKSCNLSTHKITQPLKKTCSLSTKKIMQPLRKTIVTLVTVLTVVTVVTKKTFFTQKRFSLKKTFLLTKKPLHIKRTQPLYTHKNHFSHKISVTKQSFCHKISVITQPHATSPQKNIARIAKRCPENMTLVVKCVKLHFPKKTDKVKETKRGCIIFL